ncbi:MAG TPA: hypothetical protein VF119_08980 [Candidatus Limnocylindrales bacterium]
MSLGATLVASFLVALARPTTWPLALATFLLRGGIVLVLAPIVVIPSAVGLANVIGPMLTSFVFGGMSTALIVAVAAAIAAFGCWIVIGGFVAAAAEAEAIVIVATDEEVAGSVGISPVLASERALVDRARSATAWRVLAVRLVAHLPLILALAWGAFRIVSVTYHELTLPSDVDSPLIVRVVRGAPDAVALLVASWIVGEALGALATRRVVQAGDGVARALGGGLGWLVRHPVRTAVVTLLPLAALLAVVVPSAAAAAASWEALRTSLATGQGFVPTFLLLALFIVLWAGGLLLLAVIGSWRAAAWTVEMAGTFGGVRPDRPGGWNADDESGTLTDLRPRGVDPDPR